MVLLGEVRTSLLRNSGSATRHAVTHALGLMPGERVRVAERPIAHAVSPELVTGVDCLLPTASGSRVRGVGTVTARGVITGGRVLQGSAYVAIAPDRAERRREWPYYLARPGVLETLGRSEPDDIVKGFLAGPSADAALSVIDLGAVGERLITSVQMAPEFDHVVPFRSRRTRLRWVATFEEDGGAAGAELTIADDTVRTLHLRLPGQDPRAVIGFCEDVALHDWTLTTLLRIVENCGMGVTAEPAAIGRLRPAIDHLLHLWMPGAHVAEALLPLWEGLERRPGFTRQWQNTVTRVRDQVSLYTLTLLGHAGLNGSGVS